MGCFVHGLLDAAKETLSELLLEEAGTTERRVGIYICPECGDIGCGRFSVLVDRRVKEVVWLGFVSENGYEDPLTFEDLGPFHFEPTQYKNAIRRAAEV